MTKSSGFQRVVGTVLAIGLLVSGSFPASTAFAETAPKIDAAAAYMIDAQTGQVLYEQNENVKRYPASTTKIMTLLLTMEAVKSGKVKLTDIVPVTDQAYNIEGSSVWLDPKEKWTLADMIKFITVPSANDACVATAIFVAGSENAFVQKMNEKAKELGMTSTHFTDTNGLHNPDHYTTVHDMAIVARELITKYPEILNYSKIKSFSLRNGKNFFENTNKLIGVYPGMDGLKTGFTDQAGYNLVSTADRNGYRIIGLVFGAANEAKRVSETTKLLDIGFNDFDHKKVFTKDQSIPEKAPVPNGVQTEVPAAVQSDLFVDVPKGKDQDVKQKVVFSTLRAPVQKGQVIGQIQMVDGKGQVLTSTNLIAATNVEKGSWIRLFFRNLFSSISHSISSLFK